MTAEDDSSSFPKCAALAAVAVVVVAAIAIPNLIQARRQGGEAPAIGMLKTISTSQSLFREGDKDGNRVLDYGTLAQLSAAGLIDPVLGSGTKQGYLVMTAPSAATPEFLWFAVANPVTPGVTGDRYFCTNQAGAIFYTLSGSFTLDTRGACEIPKHALPVGK